MGMHLFSVHLDSSRLTIRADNEALCWMVAISETTGTLARWQLKLSKYKSDIVHSPELNYKISNKLPLFEIKGDNRAFWTMNTQSSSYLNRLSQLWGRRKYPTTAFAKKPKAHLSHLVPEFA